MKAKQAKKQEANPYYQANSKKQARLARNERKLKSATDDFNSVNAKIQEIIDQINESRFQRVVPLVAQVTVSQLINIEVSTMARAGKMLQALEDWPEDIMEANLQREVELEKLEPDEPEESGSLTLRKSAPTAEKKDEIVGSQVKSEIFTTDVYDDCLIFDMDKPKTLDEQPTSQQSPVLQKESLSSPLKTSTNPFFEFKQPSSSGSFDAKLDKSFSAGSEESKSPFEQPPASHQYSTNFFTAYEQPLLGMSGVASDLNSFQQAQFSQMMMMYQNPELMKQMQQFMTPTSESSFGTNMFATAQPQDSQFKFSFNQSLLNDPFAETSLSTQSQEARPGTKNPFAQTTPPGSSKESSFFNLL